MRDAGTVELDLIYTMIDLLLLLRGKLFDGIISKDNKVKLISVRAVSL